MEHPEEVSDFEAGILKKTNHPNDLIEQGKKYPEAIQALREAKDMLMARGMTEKSIGLLAINKVLKGEPVMPDYKAERDKLLEALKDSNSLLGIVVERFDLPKGKEVYKLHQELIKSFEV